MLNGSPSLNPYIEIPPQVMSRPETFVLGPLIQEKAVAEPHLLTYDRHPNTCGCLNVVLLQSFN